MNKNNKFTVQENILKIGDNEIVFKDKIKDIIEISNMLILLMLHHDGSFFNENVLGVCLLEKKIKWQIAQLDYGTEVYCPFVGMKFNNNHLYLNNWCDINLIVDPITGEILERSLPVKS
jgi:hypothetical protein